MVNQPGTLLVIPVADLAQHVLLSLCYFLQNGAVIRDDVLAESGSRSSTLCASRASSDLVTGGPMPSRHVLGVGSQVGAGFVEGIVKLQIEGSF